VARWHLWVGGARFRDRDGSEIQHGKVWSPKSACDFQNRLWQAQNQFGPQNAWGSFTGVLGRSPVMTHHYHDSSLLILFP
jgi:hypothetical protein